MTLIREFLERLEKEEIPSYSMSESQLKKANEILKELVEAKEQ